MWRLFISKLAYIDKGGGGIIPLLPRKQKTIKYQLTLFQGFASGGAYSQLGVYFSEL